MMEHRMSKTWERYLTLPVIIYRQHTISRGSKVRRGGGARKSCAPRIPGSPDTPNGNASRFRSGEAARRAGW